MATRYVVELLRRIAILTSESKTHKQQLQTMLDKGRHDDELIDALLVCNFLHCHVPPLIVGVA